MVVFPQLQKRLARRQQGKSEADPASDSQSLAQELNHIARESADLGVVLGKAVAQRLGIAHADLECLDMILVRGRVTAGEIAAASGLTTGAVTGLLDRLEHANLVFRERDAADRRKVYVMVLPAALEIASIYYGPLERKMNKLIASYSRDELSLLVEYFKRSREIIRQEIQKLD